MRRRYKDFKWTTDEIVEEVLRCGAWPGFAGEQCHTCKKTANVLAYGHGWFCICGAYNAQHFSHYPPKHAHPDLGPGQSVMKAVRRQLIYPPYVAKYLFVRRRQPGDRKWQIVLRAADGSEQRPSGLYYEQEGCREEMNIWIEKIKDWPQHRDYMLLAEAV